MNKRLQHAVVIGGSIGGLMAARVLSDYFEQVTVLERASFPDKPEPRKTVPQGNHIHVLLGKGRDIVESNFPGLIQEMEEGGANMIDSSQDFCWFFQGAWRPRNETGIPMLLTLRPHVDWHIRRRLLKDCSNVTIKTNCLVTNLLASDDRSRITGVSYKIDDGNEQTMSAELVVDVSGRNSKAPDWLAQYGYERPKEKEIGISLSYTSRVYQRPADFKEDWKFLVLYPCFPNSWRAGFISTIQGNRWIVTLNGYFGEHAPLDDEGFLEFARTLPKQDIYDRIRDLKPESETMLYRIPRIRRRYYEKLSRFPDGLVVMGDANCVFNPIFGQGMTAVCLYADALRKAFQEWEGIGHNHSRGFALQGFSMAYQKSLPSALNLPWFLTNMIDLSYPQTKGQRPFGMRIISWFLSRTLEAISRNPRLNYTFLEVLHLQAGLGALLKPNFVLPVLLHGIKAFFIPLEKRAETQFMPLLKPGEQQAGQ